MTDDVRKRLVYYSWLRSFLLQTQVCKCRCLCTHSPSELKPVGISDSSTTRETLLKETSPRPPLFPSTWCHVTVMNRRRCPPTYCLLFHKAPPPSKISFLFSQPSYHVDRVSIHIATLYKRILKKEKVMHLPKLTELVSRWVRIRIKNVWLFNPFCLC